MKALLPADEISPALTDKRGVDDLRPLLDRHAMLLQPHGHAEVRQELPERTGGGHEIVAENRLQSILAEAADAGDAAEDDRQRERAGDAVRDAVA